MQLQVCMFVSLYLYSEANVVDSDSLDEGQRIYL